jgi:chloride channel protein, CIC family
MTLRARVLRHEQGDGFMLGLAAAVGLATGLFAVVLIRGIQLVQRIAFGTTPPPGWVIVAVPVTGAFVVGLMITYWVPEASGSGIVRTMQTIALRGGRFRERVPAGTIAATSVSLGTGASGGREGPIVLIGGSTASLIGRFFALDEERMRTLVAAGAAAGIGASFNAPIGGMLFAIELVIGGYRARSLQAVVISSVIGSVTARQFVGSEIIYQPNQTYGWSTVTELGLYLILGVAAAGFGLLFLYGEDISKRVFARIHVWQPVRLAIGGLGVGLLALVVPEVLGTGDNLPPIDGIRDPIQAMLDGDVGYTGLVAAGFLLLLAVAKLLATCFSIGSGNSVGTFAPAIFVGAAMGGSLGYLGDTLLPGLDIEPGAFALVGMAAVFAAAARAPLTAILIIFEITNDYELVLPLMLAAGVAMILAERVQPESVYTLPLRHQGIVYSEPEDVDIMQTVRVGEIMTTDPNAVPPSMTLDELQREFDMSRSHGFPVAEDGRLVGIVTVTDLARATELAVEDALAGSVGTGDLTVGDICTRKPLTVTPEDPVFRALRRMATLDVGRLPVVAPDDHSRLVGMLRRVDLVKGYQRAITRSMGAQQRRQSSQLRDLVGATFVELLLASGAPAENKAVREVSWPRSTVVTAVRRQGQAIMPNGDTVLRAGDEIVVLADRDATDQVRELLVSSNGRG